jgi:hypothetical protein
MSIGCADIVLSGQAFMVTKSKSESLSSAKERRRFGRFATRLPVATYRESLTGASPTRRLGHCRLQIQDFSLGGIRAESSVPLKVNECLTLRLPPSGTRPAAELTGRVIHCRRREDRYQVGIEFCQTRSDVTASPWHRVSSLFSLACQFSGTPLTESLSDS